MRWAPRRKCVSNSLRFAIAEAVLAGICEVSASISTSRMSWGGFVPAPALALIIPAGITSTPALALIVPAGIISTPALALITPIEMIQPWHL